jgi:hypothetical protein
LTQIEAPTPCVWIIGRTKTDGRRITTLSMKFRRVKTAPLSECGLAPKPIEVKLDPSIDMKTPPKAQVDTMPAGQYFAYAAELLKLEPPLFRSADHRSDETDRHRARQEF